MNCRQQIHGTPATPVLSTSTELDSRSRLRMRRCHLAGKIKSRGQCPGATLTGGGRMDVLILVRADDHLLVGVSWSGCTVSSSDAGTLLTAGAAAHLTLILPP